jgi:hypothetical protein
MQQLALSFRRESCPGLAALTGSYSGVDIRAARDWVGGLMRVECLI